MSRYVEVDALQLLATLHELTGDLDAAGSLAEGCAHGFGVMTRIEEAEEKVHDAIEALERVIADHAA